MRKNLNNQKKNTMKRIALLTLLTGFAFSLFAQEPSNEMMQLTKIKSGLKTRQISSHDKTGGNADFIGKIKDGEKFVPKTMVHLDTKLQYL